MMKFLGYIYKHTVKSVVSPEEQNKGVCHFKIKKKERNEIPISCPRDVLQKDFFKLGIVLLPAASSWIARRGCDSGH